VSKKMKIFWKVRGGRKNENFLIGPWWAKKWKFFDSWVRGGQKTIEMIINVEYIYI
jgi:hypothetical protein